MQINFFKFFSGLLVLVATPPALAMGLGSAQVRSALGQPLNVLIPIITESVATVDVDCFALVAPARDTGIPAITKAKLTVQYRDNTAFLRLTTATLVNEPVIAFAIESHCPGTVKREYVALVDMANDAAPTAVAVTPPASVATVAPKPATPAPIPPVPRRVRTTKQPIATPKMARASGLRLSTDLLWLPGEHVLTAEQDAALKHLRSRLSIDAGGNEAEVDKLQDDIVSTQKQLAQAKQELVALHAQQRVTAIKTATVNNSARVMPVSQATWFSYSVLAWSLGIGLLLAGLVYLLTRRRKLPDLMREYSVSVVHTPVVPSVEPMMPSMPLSADVMEDTIDELPSSVVVSPSSTIAKTYNLNTAQSDLAVPNVLRATEEAEVFLELGYVDRAIKVLTDDIAAHPRNPPAVWLLLLNIYHQQDNRAAFDEAVAAFSMRFNLIPPTWDSISKPMLEGEGLLAVPHVLAKVVSLWPRPECQDYLSELLYDDRQGTRMGFSLDVYQHIAWLKEVLCMMTRTELAIAEDVQRGNDLDFDLNF
ncbi:MAG: hypothetical protein HOP20_00150 [Sulfuriferula sp.]|nr:hypothetical protein [Sulfuriferula sp.]